MSEAIEAIRRKYLALQGLLNENTRRRWAATEARELGRGGITKVAQATGLNPATIRVGLAELNTAPAPPLSASSPENWGESRKKGEYRSSPLRVRAPGGGRKPVTTTDPTLLSDLEAFIDPDTGADLAPLRWTSKSTRELAGLLGDKGHRVSQQKVAELLRDLGFSFQGPWRGAGGRRNPERDHQFQQLDSAVRHFQSAGQPVIVVQISKRVVSDSRTGETEDAGEQEAREATSSGHAASEGRAGSDWGSVGTDYEGPALIPRAIRTWWEIMGRQIHPSASHLLIVVPRLGSGRRTLERQLQELANEAGLRIDLVHAPAGTIRWNGVVHRLVSRITLNWPDRPLTSYEIIVSLIGPPARHPDPPPVEESRVVSLCHPQQTIADQPAARISDEKIFSDLNYRISPDLRLIHGVSYFLT